MTCDKTRPVNYIAPILGYPRGAPEPVDVRSSVTVSRQNNAVHQNTAGHNQVAGAIFCWLKDRAKAE